MNKRYVSAKTIVEGIIIVEGVFYIALQLIYGVRYHVPFYRSLTNILAVVAVYIIETYLYLNPCKINRMPEEECVGDVRKYSKRMAQAIKLIFNSGLLVPCIFDIKGIELKEGFSVIFIFLLLITAVYYEWRILSSLRRK